MKKSGIILGTVGFVLFLVAIFFKYFHWPGAAMLTVLGSVIGIIFYAYAMFSKDLLSLGTCEKTNGIGLSIVMIVNLIAFTFKRMQWPGANVLLGISILLFLLIMLKLIISMFSGASKYNKDIANIYKFSILFMAAILVMFGMQAYS